MMWPAKIALYLLTMAMLALYLPRLYDRIMFERVEKTHLFYSAVNQRFIYTERVAEYDPEAAAKAEDHHSDIIYQDQDGRYYDRLEFERLLPFIYYRNMELRGYLPLRLGGRILDARTIRKERLVLELPAAAIGERTPAEDVWPLFESDPGQAGLIFPDDRCRFTPISLEFVNADYNRVDKELTENFTKALHEAGFVFPGRFAAGHFTILKPYDDGVFLADAAGGLFHLKRTHGRPWLRRVPLPDGVIPRHVRVTESEGFHALLLDSRDRLHLVSRQPEYRLITLPLPEYRPERMDCKIIFDPLHRTAVYSDDSTIRAVVMDRDFTPFGQFSRPMSRAARTWKHTLRDMLFPFSLHLFSPHTRMVDVHLRAGALFPVPACLLGLFLFVPFARYKRLPIPSARFWTFAALFGLAGPYALIAAGFIEE